MGGPDLERFHVDVVVHPRGYFGVDEDVAARLGRGMDQVRAPPRLVPATVAAHD